jgi:hypothetical protein
MPGSQFRSLSSILASTIFVGLFVIMSTFGFANGTPPKPSASTPPVTVALHWNDLKGIAPGPAVQRASMAYNAKADYLLLFGGANSSGAQNETWAFFGKAWHDLHLAVAPSPRYGAAMAYDPIDGYVLLFGGTSGYLGQNDTWDFSGGNWTQLHPTASPSARAGASMVYDGATDYILMFGGTSNYRCGCAVTGNEWAFSHGKWSEKNPRSLPGQTVYTLGMAYDPPIKEALVFGGWQPNAGNVNTTWILSGHNWTTSPGPGALTPRQGSAMAFDWYLNQTVLFGGATSGFVGDTWAYSSVGWQSLNVGGPSPRGWGSMAWDPALHGVVLFGGANATLTFTDTWVLK